MLNVLAAEIQKLTRHRAIWGLVWIFPVGVTLLFLIFAGWRLGHPRPPTPAQPPELWIAEATMFWRAAHSLPVRCLVGAFAALAFGGEFGWNTWKLITPHARRVQLIAAKYLAVFGLVAISFVLTAALMTAYNAAGNLLEGVRPPAGVSAGVLLAAQARGALAALPYVLLSISYGSTVAMLFRSSMAGVVGAVALTVIEGLVSAFAPLMKRDLYLALPSYHLANLASWVQSHSALTQPLPSGVLGWDWKLSLLVAGGWILAGVAITTVAFERQDLN